MYAKASKCKQVLRQLNDGVRAKEWVINGFLTSNTRIHLYLSQPAILYIF